MRKHGWLARLLAACVIVGAVVACSSPTEARVPKEIEEEDPDPKENDKSAFLLLSEAVRLA